MKTAARRFTGELRAGAKVFRPGDPITAAEAKELGLEGKPHLWRESKHGTQQATSDGDDAPA